MKHTLHFALFAALVALSACSQQVTMPAQIETGWQADTLGADYEMRHVIQPHDYSGAVISTIIRKQAACDSCQRAVLYIHGFNDYFFQKEMGDRFADSCYNFYAVDLRKYGRSIIEGQKLFETRDMKEYFADIDSALSQIIADGNKDIVLIGHSTGGLTSSYYLNENKGKLKYPISALILNSPFLDWNQSETQEKYLIPAVTALSPVLKQISIKQSGSTAYSESLLASKHGEWDYNTNWKLEKSPNVSIGWISAIESAQRSLQSGKADVNVPVLLLHSDKSISGPAWTPEFNRADAVLSVTDISKYGKKLSSAGVTEIVETNGIHDLVLSSPTVRGKVYDDIFRWLKSN